MAKAIGASIVLILGMTAAILAFGQDAAGLSLFQDKVGLVVVAGPISTSIPTMRHLDRFARDNSIRAIILRVDSPGGAVGPSQEIYREVERTRAIKPVVCSMGGVAASGGYYIAAPCTKIVANPGTLTGSIGVYAAILNMKGLFEKLGLELQVIKAGKLKAAGMPDKPLTEAERAMLQSVMADTHEQFITDTARARGMKPEDMRKLADGSVFTGRQAKQLGLVDNLGNLRDAINLAAKLAGIKGRPKVVVARDEEQSLLGLFLEQRITHAIKVLFQELAPQGLQYRYLPE